MPVHLPPPLPPIETVLGAIDLEGRRTVRAAGNLGLAAVRQALPARSGRARRGQAVRVKRTAVGLTVEIGPTSRVRYPNGVSAREVTRFVVRGTGVHGPTGRPIRPRKARAFRLPGGWYAEELQGQRGQDTYRRAEGRVEALAERELAAGAQRAARAAELVIGKAT